MKGPQRTAESGGTVPRRPGIMLTTLILGALVCNLNLSVANIALPEIGRTFDADQALVNLVALGTTLGLAMSVLYLGAIGDRYGRKGLLLLGMVLTLPASALAAWAPTIEVLAAARVFTGVAGGMAYPTTLALITALWPPGAARVKAIALWSGVSGGGAVLGPAVAGLLLEQYWWGSVFLIAVPFAVVTFALVAAFVPAHVNESTAKVDNLGGVLSVLMVAALVLGLNTLASPTYAAAGVVLLVIAAVLIFAFGWWQLRAPNPLYDLNFARRRLFWVPGLAGLIVFGALMGSMFVGQQFLQNVIEYSTFAAGIAVLPAAVGMIGVAPFAARMTVNRGSRDTILLGYLFVLLSFLIMLFGWTETTPTWMVLSAYLLIGIGAGLALAPASRALTSSVPVRKVGMASGTADLQRDLGGSIMQALLGVLLTAGYASSFLRQIGDSRSAESVSQSTQEALTASYSSAANLAEGYPQYSDQIISSARESFLAGSNAAYAAACIAAILGAALVVWRYPGKTQEQELLAEYTKLDAQSAADDADQGQPRP